MHSASAGTPTGSTAERMTPRGIQGTPHRLHSVGRVDYGSDDSFFNRPEVIAGFDEADAALQRTPQISEFSSPVAAAKSMSAALPSPVHAIAADASPMLPATGRNSTFGGMASQVLVDHPHIMLDIALDLSRDNSSFRGKHTVHPNFISGTLERERFCTAAVQRAFALVSP